MILKPPGPSDFFLHSLAFINDNYSVIAQPFSSNKISPFSPIIRNYPPSTFIDSNFLVVLFHESRIFSLLNYIYFSNNLYKILIIFRYVNQLFLHIGR